MRRVIAVLAAALLAATVAGCSSDDGSSSSSDGPAECNRELTSDDEIRVTVIGSVASDVNITSFDGTTIRLHWFPAVPAGVAPTILMGPGWGQAGDTSPEGTPILGALGIQEMTERGYNVVTWDPRGFGASSGTATVNDPEAEGRDVQVILDWLTTRPSALTDGEGDPAVGMVGASYGGGIQLTTAGLDCRIDAIVPTMGWHSLETSLYPHETVKAGWAGVLSDVAADADLDPHIASANASGQATGTLSDEDRQWFVDRGPGDLVEQIRTPTLLVQGTVDTLFTLQEAVTNFEIIQGNDVPVSMLWYCGGHGACLTEAGDPADITEATFAWLDRHLKDEDVDTGPVVSVIDQDGRRWTGDDYPAEPDGAVEASGAGGTLALTADSVAGPLVDAESADLLTGLVSPITPARAETAVETTITADTDGLVLGAPRLTMTYTGTTPDGPEPTRVFAQLVDAETGFVLGNQITPVPVVLDGEEQTAVVDLEIVAHHLAAGDELILQIVATTPAFATPRLGGSIDIASLAVSLPTTEALTAA
ncbi:MAG TPA: CocE/NonD family hydrolase [Iamia sp.]|nr:CocE/NonD family hydrolase [Iamia sp.]